ncbi:uncharacterized protein LOC135835774 [Planococcus citri]|uniref:uncharacterized protein LOC135835774 n=1 Tax=Planococcus citri TaxID=170843 RepID=UPI0031F87A69
MKSRSLSIISEEILDFGLGNDEHGSSNNVTFHEELPSLQDIISFRVAVALWYNIIFEEDDLERAVDLLYNCWHLWQEKIAKHVQSLSLPIELQNKIEKHFDSIGYKLREFDTYHHTKVTTADSGSIFILMKNCVWKMNDIIDYKETALKMLSNSGLNLSEEEKFQIKCKYGLIDEIKNTSLESLSPAFIEKVSTRNHRIANYWICYLKNELYKISIKYEYSSSIEGIIFIKHTSYIWPAIEYFWDCMDVYEQHSVAIALLAEENSADKFQKNILSRMTEYQQRRIYSEIPVNIMRNFFRHESQIVHARAVWNRMRYLITSDQFVELIQCIDFNERSQFIWDTATDFLKNYVVRCKTSLIVDKYLKCSISSEMYNESTFLLSFLSFANKNCRKTIVLQNKFDLVTKNKPCVVEKILKLCIRNKNELEDFKDSIMKSYIVKLHCYKLLNLGYFENFCTFIDTYSTKKYSSTYCKIKLLTTWELEKPDLRYTLDKWNELIKFIDQTFSETSSLSDPLSAVELKKRVIRKFSEYCHRIWSNSNMNSEGDMETAISQLLDTDELRKFKKKVLRNFRICILEDAHYWLEFEEKFFHQLVSWCLENQNEVQQFKTSLPIDEIIDKLWIEKNHAFFDGRKGSRSNVYDPCLLIPVMEKILLWYFGNVEDLKQYKLKKLYNSEVIRNMIQRSFRKGAKCDRLNAILLWFLDNDEKEIEKFKSEFNYDKFPE